MENKIIEKKEELTMDSFRELVSSFQKSRVILTAYELDLFNAVTEEGATSEEVSKNIKTNLKATERLMNVLCALGFLIKVDNIYKPTDFTKKYLFKNSPDYIDGLMHLNTLWHTWGTLTEVVRKGKPIKRTTIQKDKKWIKAFIAAMNDRAKMHAPFLVKMLNLSKVNKMLDLGGGSGAYTIAFVKAKPKLKAYIFDLPEVIDLTKKYVKAEGLTKYISFIEGDYLKDDIGNNYDLILLSQIIHSNSPSDNKKLIGKCANALNKNGQLIIQDFIINEDKISPLQTALFSINMLVGTKEGDTYTEKEVFNWLKQHNFINIIRKDTDWKTTIIMATKK